MFVLNVVTDASPDLATGTQAEIEEERRLLYVAMTRVRDQLTLVHPLRFHVCGQARFGDRHVFAPRTRFITSGDLRHFKLTSGGAPGQHGSASVQPVAPVDLGARMCDMWA